MWRIGAFFMCYLICCHSDDGNSQLPRIVNGDDATENEFPFLVSLLLTDTYSNGGPDDMNICGASLIAQNVVLTAAHCVLYYLKYDTGKKVEMVRPPRTISVTLGQHDIEMASGAEVEPKVRNVIVHESYDSDSIDNDIALIILEEKQTITSTVELITLPVAANSDYYNQGAPVTLAGWGTTESGSTSDTLKKLEYHFTGHEACQEEYGSSVTDSMVCTGQSPLNSHGSTGDSGGPLFTKNNATNEWLQLALVSWGPPAEQQSSTTYDVNANLLYFSTWLSEKTSITGIQSHSGTFSTRDDEQTKMIESLNNYSHLVYTYTSDIGKYVQISLKSSDNSKLGTMGVINIYDGPDTYSSLITAVLSPIADASFTASTAQGLTIEIKTSVTPSDAGITFYHRQVMTQGSNTKTVCHPGWYPCTDRTFCMPRFLFCDSKTQCPDSSDYDACPPEIDCTKEENKNATQCQVDCNTTNSCPIDCTKEENKNAPECKPNCNTTNSCPIDCTKEENKNAPECKPNCTDTNSCPSVDCSKDENKNATECKTDCEGTACPPKDPDCTKKENKNTTECIAYCKANPEKSECKSSASPTALCNFVLLTLSILLSYLKVF